MNPEYPSGHSIPDGAVGAVLKAEVGPETPVRLATSSPTARGAGRPWTRSDEFMQEVAMACVQESVERCVDNQHDRRILE